MTHCSSNWLTGLRGMGGGVGEAGSSCLHTTGPLKSLRELGLLLLCFCFACCFFNELGKVLKGLSSRAVEISFSQMPSKIFLEIRPEFIATIYSIMSMHMVIKMNIFLYFLLTYLRENLETLQCWIEIL